LGPEPTPLETLLALCFTVYSRAVLGHSPPKQKKKVVNGKSYMAEVDNVGQEWKGICLFFWEVPTSLRWQTMGAHIFRV
jgi:hypothetical protein